MAEKPKEQPSTPNTQEQLGKLLENVLKGDMEAVQRDIQELFTNLVGGFLPSTWLERWGIGKKNEEDHDHNHDHPSADTTPIVDDPEKMTFIGKVVHPLVKKATITSKFNPKRLHPISGKVRAHEGIDFGASNGTPICAIADGTVVYSGVSGSMTSGYGNLIAIEHKDGTVSRYAHCHTLQVREGTQVTAGDIIGTVGSTGGSTGAHLHLEIRQKTKTGRLQAIEPKAWFQKHGVTL